LAEPKKNFPSLQLFQIIAHATEGTVAGAIYKGSPAGANGRETDALGGFASLKGIETEVREYQAWFVGLRSPGLVRRLELFY
jgi:hypothetical protein